MAAELEVESPSNDGTEPPMYLQRPSSARSQDVSHILAQTFRQLFTRDTVDNDTVKNLDQSRGSNDQYHESYVAALNKVQEERNRSMQETAMLERHIMQAQARAMSADERALSRMSGGSDKFPDLGLPPVRAHFRSCIDTELLRSHNLLTSEDFTVDELPIVPPPQASKIPEYARETRSSSKRRELTEISLSPRQMEGEGLLSSRQDAAHVEDDVELMSLASEEEHVLHDALEDPAATKSNLWRTQIGPEEREDNRKVLANLQAKVDYLKNPRHIPPSAPDSKSLIKAKHKHAKQPGIKPPPATIKASAKKEPSTVFLPSPSVVTFTQYNVSKVYEMTLELKNVTSVLRPVRVIPPRTTYFSISLGQFPSEKGLVAPGMSCHYTIRFSPDSLGDYDDSITVQTQSSQPLVIQLQGRRAPPKLTLPSKLSIGQCLVGGFKATQVIVKNRGGPGMFCLMPRSSWPATNFKSVVAPGAVPLPPFHIRPGRFELGAGQSIVLDVLFRPTEVQEYTQTVTMVCDNCHVHHIQVHGEGQVASVEVTSIEGGLSEAVPGEQSDRLASCMVRFDTLNPYTYIQKTVTVKNNVNVDLPFKWRVCKPHLQPPLVVDNKPRETAAIEEDTSTAKPSNHENPQEDHKTADNEKLTDKADADESSVVDKTNEEHAKPEDDGKMAEDDDKTEERKEKDKVETTVEEADNDGNADLDDVKDAEQLMKEAMIEGADRIEEESSAFSVQPKSEIFPASGTMDFTVTLAPPKVKDYHNVLELVLLDIPQLIPVAVVPPLGSPSLLGHKPILPGAGPTESRPPSVNTASLSSGVAPGGPPVGGTGTSSPTPLPPGSRPPSSGSLTNKSNTHQEPSRATAEDILSLAIETKGSCQPFSVLLQPYAIHLPGLQRVETAVRRQFRMINASVSSIFYQWEKVDADYILEVQPPIDEVPAQSEVELEVTVSSSKPVTIDHTLYCHIQHLDEPLTLHVHAEIQGPEVSIENPDVNFGLVQLGEIGKAVITLRNTCQVTAHWTIGRAEEHAKHALMRQAKEQGELIDEDTELTFLPSSGDLRPLETFDLQVMYIPHSVCSMKTILQLNVQDGKSSFLSVRGEVQQSEVCLLSSTLDLTDIYLDVPSTHTIHLYNKTLLPATYEWLSPEGSDASQCSINIDPPCGTLESRETKPVTLTFTPHAKGVLGDIRIPCYITDMKQPLYLTITADVAGLSVRFAVQEQTDTQNEDETSSDDVDKSSDLMLDFGSDIRIGEQVTRTLIIENQSGITAPYHIEMDYYTAKPPTPPKRPYLESATNRRPSLLNRSTAQMLTDSGRNLRDIGQVYLRHDKGAAFLASPMSAVLQPFSTATVTVTAYSDMWGHYTDHLICKIEGMDTVRIPLQLSVSGCPLVFQMVAAQPQRQPVLRFGGHVSGIEPIKRQMRLNNPSPNDIRVDWQMYNIDNEQPSATADVDQPQERPLDLIVSYDQSFPLLDENGEEIVPEYEDESPCSTDRAPTDVIMDSPCTSDLTSKQRTVTDEEPDTERQEQVVKRPRIISLTLRSHIGDRADKPFSVQPPQIVIPGRGNNVITVMFTPTAGVDDRAGRDCAGLAMGYMSLTPQCKTVDNKVERSDGYNAPPVLLDLTAHIKPALLTVECKEDDGLTYRAAASDLIQHGQVLSEWHKTSSVTLSNHTENVLCFDVISADPFYLVQLDSSTKQPVVQLLHTGNTTLKPRQSVLLHVSFRISLDLLGLLDTISSNGSLDGINIETQNMENDKRIVINHQLNVHFNNGTSQSVPLAATLLMPCMLLSRDEIDFGTCLVGQTRQAEITLTNPSGSMCHWTIQQDHLSATCVEGETFTLTPDKGQLEAYATHISNNKVLITVCFTAKHTEEYEAVFLFQYLLGEAPLRLKLKGAGSYDGKHEALVNV